MELMIESVIKRLGGELARSKRHKIFKFPNGKQLVMASTPSSNRHEDEALANLSRLMGMSKRQLLTPEIRHRVRPLRPEPVPVLPVALQELPTPTATPTIPTRMSRAEAQWFKRMEKHEAQRQTKRSQQLQYLEILVHRMHDDYVETLEQEGKWTASKIFAELTCGLYVDLLRGETKFRPELMMGECTQSDGSQFNTLFVSTNRWYLDFAGDEILKSPSWISNLGQPGAIVSIEVFGEILDVEIEGNCLVFNTSEL